MWSQRLLSQVHEPSALLPAVAALLQQQRDSWPALRDGERALRTMPTRFLARGDSALLAQANVRRSVSTFAKTDARSIAERPCFLCESNLPAEERGIAFDDLMVMANPFPALPEHLTLAARDHVPQRLSNRLVSMLRAACALGSDYFLLYNGPHCGASAPDHFHFQAGRRSPMPIFDHSQLDVGSGVRVLCAGARNAVHIRAARQEDAVKWTEHVLAQLAAMDAEPPEPKVNVLTTFRGEHFNVLIFPRVRHRPANFFEPGQALAISPASLEMGGLVVVCDEDQYHNVVASDLERIFQEVCVSAEQLRHALEMS
ncbi:MAG: DUF4922 domain-containing protein [Gammaproteobacteria bacterium]